MADQLETLASATPQPGAIQHGSRNAQLAASTKSWTAGVRESFKTSFGYDPEDVWKNSSDPRFSLKTVKEALKKTYKLSEAVTESQLSQLIRYGVIRTATDYYNLVPTVYKAVAQMETSRGYEEAYFPLQRNDVPVELQDTEPAPESRLGGNAIRIKNKEFGRILAFSKRLVDDDQTGQVSRQAGRMGEAMVYAEEQAFIVALFAAGVPSNLIANGGIIPASNLAGQTGAAFPTTAGAISQLALEQGYASSTNVVDILGNLMMVTYDTLLISTADEILTRRLMQSMYVPQMLGPTAGVLGTNAFAENVLKGMFTIQATPFVNRARAGLATGNPWVLMKAGEGVVFQSRTNLSVVMENPDAGKSFEERSYRYQSNRRFGVGVVEPRFVYFGN